MSLGVRIWSKCLRADGGILRYVMLCYALLCYAKLRAWMLPEETMNQTADKIRAHGREKYVLPARERRLIRFSIRAGDVVREMRLSGRAPAICSALKSRLFLQSNGLRIVERTGPQSGQSTTVTYTYEFVGALDQSRAIRDVWSELRGSLKDVFAEFGGGEAYLRHERESFYGERENS